jgi:predicted transcriptional regulator
MGSVTGLSAMASRDRVLQLRARLTERDLLLLEWLADHQVLTTPQIATALFSSLGFAQRRLLALHRAGVIERFRPLRPGGGAYPWHYVLAQTGAETIAAARGQSSPRPSETAQRIRRIATSRTLDHRLGVNQFFTDLAGHARTHPPTRLERWWSEARCAAPGAFGPGLVSPIRPDGHASKPRSATRRTGVAGPVLAAQPGPREPLALAADHPGGTRASANRHSSPLRP